MPSVTLTKIVKEPGGRIRVRFGKRETEYASLAEMKASVRAQLGPDDLEALVLALALTRQPNLTNTAALEGKTLNVDLSATAWGTIN